MAGGPLGLGGLGAVIAGYLLAALVSGGLAAWVARRHGGRRIGRVYAYLMAALTVWTLGTAAKLLTLNPDLYVALSVVQYVGIGFSTVFLFLFGLVYVGRGRWLEPRVVALLLVMPALAVVALGTTNRHRLFYSGYDMASLGGGEFLASSVGPLFWAWTAYGWALLIAASALVLLGSWRRSPFYRAEAVVVVTGVAVAWGVNAGFVAFGWPHPAIDPTPIGLTATGLLFAVAAFPTRLDRLLPAARSQVLDAIDDAVIAVDSEGRVADANRAGRRVLGGELPLRRPEAEVLPDPLLEADASEEETVELVVDGQAEVYRHRRLPVGPEGVHGEVVVLTEFTELVRARQELERQNERLEEFASVVSHDLRTPLSIARGNLEIAMEDLEHDRLEDVAAAHERMERLIEDLLTLARQGRIVGETEAVDLGAVALDAWSGVGTDEARLDLGEGLGSVEADPGRLVQLLQNLFANAVDHAGPDVTVRVVATEDGFAVEDDGPGVDPEERDRLFEHGYTTSAGGTGFGLAIVKSVAEAHGWAVELGESVAGGLRVTIRDAW